MARYTTPQGVCAEGEHDFKDDLTDVNGYLSPKPPTWETFHSQGIANSRRSDRERVCRKHFLEQYKARFPDADLSKV